MGGLSELFAARDTERRKAGRCSRPNFSQDAVSNDGGNFLESRPRLSALPGKEDCLEKPESPGDWTAVGAVAGFSSGQACLASSSSS